MGSTTSLNPVSRPTDFFNDWDKPVAYSVGLSAAAAGCVGGVLGMVNPVGGIIFGATAAVANAVALTILGRLCGNEHMLTIGALMIPLFFVNAAAAAAFTATIGFPMTWVGVAICAGAVLAANVISGSYSQVR